MVSAAETLWWFTHVLFAFNFFHFSILSQYLYKLYIKKTFSSNHKLEATRYIYAIVCLLFHVLIVCFYDPAKPGVIDPNDQFCLVRRRIYLTIALMESFLLSLHLFYKSKTSAKLHESLGHPPFNYERYVEGILWLWFIIYFIYIHVQQTGALRDNGQGIRMCGGFDGDPISMTTLIAFAILFNFFLLYIFLKPICLIQNEDKECHYLEESLRKSIGEIVWRHCVIVPFCICCSWGKYLAIRINHEIRQDNNTNFGIVFFAFFIPNLDFVLNNISLALLTRPKYIYGWVRCYKRNSAFGHFLRKLGSLREMSFISDDEREAINNLLLDIPSEYRESIRSSILREKFENEYNGGADLPIVEYADLPIVEYESGGSTFSEE